jgi:hypothetical protein
MSKRLAKISDSVALNVLIIFAVSVLVVTPVLIFGIPFGSGDFVHHIQLSIAYFDALGHGVLYPNWVFAENSGYGAVTVRFYPPLTHFFIAVFRFLSGDWQSAIFLNYAFWSFVGGSGMFLWAKDVLQNNRQALAVAILFIIAPYHLNQFYNSLLFAEFVALSILPFCFYYARRVCLVGRLSDVLGFAASIAFLILSNLPQTVIGAICVGIYVLFFLEKRNALRQISKLCCAGLLALAGSAFYWVRMIGEIEWLNIYQPNSDPAYDYRNHFLLSNFQLDDHGIWFASLIFVFTIVCLCVSVLATQNFKKIIKDFDAKIIVLLWVFSSFLLLPVSQPVWANFAFLQRVQFPWRFLTIVTLCACLIIAKGFGFISRENLLRKRPLVLLFVGVIIIYSAFSAKQVVLNAAFFESSRFSEAVDTLRTANGLEHWQTVWTKESVFKEKEKVIVENRTVEIKIWETETREFTVALGEPARARIACLYYPHWQASVNGRPADIRPTEDGAMFVELPDEKSEIKLLFVEPKASLISRKISVAAWLLILLLYSYHFFYLKKAQLV